MQAYDFEEKMREKADLSPDEIREVAERETVSGLTLRQGAEKWWSILNGHYAVPVYRNIPREKGEEDVAWLQNEINSKRPVTRSPDYRNWKADHYKAIWMRARRLRLTKIDVYSIVFRRFDRRVTSLNQLPNRTLKRLYEILLEMNR